MFKIISKTNLIDNALDTKHMSYRNNRTRCVNRLMIEENGKPICAYVVDKGHKNGNEIHVIYNNGIIRIYNENTKLHITDLIAREGQIKRYGIKPTKTMLKKIRLHVKNNYNYI